MDDEKNKQPQNKLPPLDYGQSFNRALCERLDAQFAGTRQDAEGKGKRALVVGLFGEWGCGKTLHLQHIHNYFHQRLPTPPTAEGPVTLPVFFNAWRYEAEEQLIIPLLKTTQHHIQQYEKQNISTATTAGNWLKERAMAAADSAIALSYGFKGKLSVPFFGELDFDPSKAVEEDKKRAAQRKNAESAIDKYSSLYYDFEKQIGNLTGRNSDGPKLNLLFLIDDLDRCLPEKAVQMLESIKLFLDVEGCSFVIALDDEVVERGIAHRYRDYGPGNNHRAFEAIAYSTSPEHYRDFRGEHHTEVANPITGFEYLEKIVQMPVRIPPPTLNQVAGYLDTHFSELFADIPAGEV